MPESDPPGTTWQSVDATEPEVWDLWSLEREVTEDDSALRSTGTAWVSEWERSWDERELVVEVEPLRGGPGEGEGEREWWVEVERGPWCGFVLGSARAFILLMDWGDVAPNFAVCFFPSDVCEVEDVEEVVEGVGE